THLSTELRGQAIFWLGQSRKVDVDFLRAVFKQATSEDVRSQIFMAVAQQRTPEGTKWLMDLARDKTADIESRKNAVFWAAQNGVSVASINTLYDDMRGDEELQLHILFILSQRNEAAALDKLFSVVKNDPDVELKTQALFWIGQKKNDPRAVAFIQELIKG
ncbi:MAG TPA: hypothetical protein VHV78_02415, partial [Gemmatimonadaceae bacterium]|nr:hypothetical protein [Gemmatimonadaceae bacterium]